MKKLLLLLFCVPLIGLGQDLPSNIVMINIPGGTFTMGNNSAPPMFDDQDPEHLVTIDNFQMGETEISNAQYLVFLNDMATAGNLMVEEGIPGDWASDSTEIANGHAWSIMADSTLLTAWSGEVIIKLSNIAGGGQDSLNRCWIEWDSISNTFSVVPGYENWPAAWVNWYGAMMFVDYYGVSLPSEAEWEYAARAGQQLEYPTNNGFLSSSQANYGTGFGGPSGESYLTPVGTLFQPNPYGLYNMTGNVSEWCLDWYDADFFQLCIDSNYCCNPVNNNVPDNIEVKVLKGGSHTYPGPFAMSSHRFDTPPFVTTDHMGFRVVERTNTTGMVTPESLEKLQIFPNPTSNYLSITVENGINNDLKIYSITGKLMFSNNNQGAITIDVSKWNRGVYIIQASGISKKLILK